MVAVADHVASDLNAIRSDAIKLDKVMPCVLANAILKTKDDSI